MKSVVLFPGQGAQHPGMGQSVYTESAAAKEIFRCASEVAGESIETLCFESTKEELSRTIHSQIAIFTCSLAVFAALKEQGVESTTFAGFSLGEYTALTASGIVSLEDGFRLVRKRGELMQQAADSLDGCMAAVLGLEDSVVEEICTDTNGTVLPVNYNCPGQLVIAGERSAVNAAAEKCKTAGARRVMPLAVSGAFHTPLMTDAAAQLREFASSISFHAPEIPVYTNVTGELLTVENMPAHFEQHMVSPVRWNTLVQTMLADGLTCAVEAGPGKTLTGFARRISKAFSCTAVESMESVLAVSKGGAE